MYTDATECVLQLQSEGSEGNLVRHRQDGHSGQVGDWVPCIPLTVGGVEAQTACCRGRGEFLLLDILHNKEHLHCNIGPDRYWRRYV